MAALLVTPVWFVALGVAWAIIRRRPDHVARYQAFKVRLEEHAKIKNG